MSTRPLRGMDSDDKALFGCFAFFVLFVMMIILLVVGTGVYLAVHNWG